jgi:amidophosphoribosyltransferase
MSDEIKHECGVALIRLLKPLSYYKKKYGSNFWALNKMYLMMEKQHNRGQDGAGLVSIKTNVEPGNEYIFRQRSIHTKPIYDIFQTVHKSIDEEKDLATDEINDDWYYQNAPFIGNIYLGHLRYGTYGKNSIHQCHPFIRKNNWKHKNLITAGNFNMTNVDQLFDQLVNIGQHPREKADTLTILERIGHFLDEEVEEIYRLTKEVGINKRDASKEIEKKLNLKRILKKSSKKWDGGYVICGIVGHGDTFVMRDPNGIRPCYYYKDSEVFIAASERPVIQTVFNKKFEDIIELEPGSAAIIKKSGKISFAQIKEPSKKLSCSFERIYFSRGSDAEIYRERIKLGKLIVDDILEEIDNDIDNSVFSFIPNTAENAYLGMLKGLEDKHREIISKKISELKKPTKELISEILESRVRTEKVAVKDVKLRTFITEDNSRDDLVQHVYDITYGTVKPTDNLVVLDDSIVRGTTLKKSIIRILSRLNPKSIVIVSSAPQIRYPDCYGIDMAKLGDFVAFRAAIELIKECKLENILDDIYEKSKKQLYIPDAEVKNYVKMVFEPFSYKEVSQKIAELIKPDDVDCEVKVVYQTVENLHKAIPDHLGDWYFSGDYPTPGGNRVVNKAFINFYEGKNERAY